MYELCGVIEHIGKTFSLGYNVAYVKEGDSWKCFSDVDAGPVSAIRLDCILQLTKTCVGWDVPLLHPFVQDPLCYAC